MQSPTNGGAGSVDRAGFSGSPGADVTGGRPTSPPSTSGHLDDGSSDRSKGNVTPVVKPATGGTSGLPPLGPSAGPAQPKLVDLPGSGGNRPPAIVPPPTPATSAAGAGGSPTGDPMPPPVAPPVGGAGTETSGLPPIPPPIPAAPDTPLKKGFEAPALPVAPLPSNSNVPRSPVQPATLPTIPSPPE